MIWHRVGVRSRERASVGVGCRPLVQDGVNVAVTLLQWEEDATVQRPNDADSKERINALGLQLVCATRGQGGSNKRGGVQIARACDS